MNSTAVTQSMGKLGAAHRRPLPTVQDGGGATRRSTSPHAPAAMAPLIATLCLRVPARPCASTHSKYPSVGRLSRSSVLGARRTRRHTTRRSADEPPPRAPTAGARNAALSRRARRTVPAWCRPLTYARDMEARSLEGRVLPADGRAPAGGEDVRARHVARQPARRVPRRLRRGRGAAEAAARDRLLCTHAKAGWVTREGTEGGGEGQGGEGGGGGERGRMIRGAAANGSRQLAAAAPRLASGRCRLWRAAATPPSAPPPLPPAGCLRSSHGRIQLQAEAVVARVCGRGRARAPPPPPPSARDARAARSCAQ